MSLPPYSVIFCKAKVSKKGRLTQKNNRSNKKDKMDEATNVVNKKLYVGGLPYATTGDELKELFSQAGAVDSAIIITDKMSGRSKGFGFVEMADEAGVKAAIEMFNGQEIGGRKVIVSEARPQEERPPRRDFGPRREY